jgi:hypothetical protein
MSFFGIAPVAIEPLLALLIGILILLVPKVFKLFRGHMLDCRRYSGTDAPIASREEVESKV